MVQNANHTFLSILSICFPEKSKSLKFYMIYNNLNFFTITQQCISVFRYNFNEKELFNGAFITCLVCLLILEVNIIEEGIPILFGLPGIPKQCQTNFLKLIIRDNC